MYISIYLDRIDNQGSVILIMDYKFQSLGSRTANLELIYFQGIQCSRGQRIIIIFPALIRINAVGKIFHRERSVIVERIGDSNFYMADRNGHLQVDIYFGPIGPFRSEE